MPKEFTIDSMYFFYIMKVIILPLGFLIKAFYSNTISSDMFGLIYSTIAFFAVLSFFISGFNGSFEYFVGKFKSKKNKGYVRSLFHYSMAIKTVVIILMSFLVWLLSELIATYYFQEEKARAILLIFLLYFISQKFHSTLKSLFIAHQLTTYFHMARFVEMASIFIISVIFFFTIEGALFYYYALAWGLGTAISLLVYTSLTVYRFPYLFRYEPFKPKLFKRYVKYSFAMFGAGVSKQIIAKTDIFVITFFLSLSAVAYYTNAIALITTFAGFVAVISRVLMPLFAQYKEEHNFEMMRKMLLTLYKQILFFIFPISLTFFLFSEVILSTIFGNEYVNGALTLSILSIFLMLRILMEFNISFLNGLGKATYVSKVILPAALFNLIGNLTVVHFLDIEGVALATGGSWLLVLVFTLWAIYRELSMKIPYLNLVKILLSAIFFVILVLVLKDSLYILNVYVTGMIILPFSYLLYIILGYLLKIYSIEELYPLLPSKLKPYVKYYHRNYFPFLK